MKKIFAALTIVILLTASSYGVFGFMAKIKFNRHMEEISAQVPSHIDITYKQGFLSSTVDVKVKVPLGTDEANMELMVATSHVIYHGPFVFQPMQDGHPAYIPIQAYIEGNLFYELSGEIDATFAEGVKQVTTTTISTYIPLMGNAKILFTNEPLSKEFDMEGETLAFDWQGFTGSLEPHGGMRDFTYEFLAPGLTIAGDGPEKFTINTITSSGSARSGNFDIGLGEYKAGIKSIAVILSEEPGDEIILDDLQIKVSADEKDGLLTISEFFDIKSVTFNDKNYGPANTTVHLRNLDAQTLSTMNQEYIAMQKDNSHDPEAMQAKLMQMVTTHGVTLLSKSPEFEFENISLKTAEGTGEVKIKVSFNGEGELIMNPFFLLGRLSAEASFAADERFLAVLAKELIKESMCDDEDDQACDQQAAKASSEQLQNFIINKQLLLENGRYNSSISFKDGAATLNDQPMPIF